MTAAMPSNFLEVCQRLEVHPELNANQRERGISAVRSSARQLLRLRRPVSRPELATLSTSDPIMLDQCLRALQSRRSDITERSMRQVVSHSRRYLRLAGVPIPDGRGRLPLGAAWQVLLDELPTAARKALFPFASWCTDASVEPAGVATKSIDAYRLALLEKRPPASAMQTVRLVVRTWNADVAGIFEWALRVDVPGVQRDRVMRQDLPDALLQQISAFARRLKPRRVTDYAPATRDGHDYLLRLMASDYWNATSLQPVRLEDLVSIEAADAVLKAMTERLEKKRGKASGLTTSYQVASMFYHLACAFRPDDASLIDALRDRRHQLAPSVRQLGRDTRNLLRNFTRYDNVVALLEFPSRCYGILGRQTRLSQADRHRLTVAFAMLLLIRAPAYPHEIASATFGPGANLERVHVGGAKPYVKITWPEAGYGNKAMRVHRLTGPDLEIYDRYISDVRVAHPQAASNYLFPGRQRQSKNPAWLSQQIASLTARDRSLGIRVNASDLRLLMAFIVLARDPNDREIASRFIGHIQRASLDALAEHVAHWRAEDVFKDWPTAY